MEYVVYFGFVRILQRRHELCFQYLKQFLNLPLSFFHFTLYTLFKFIVKAYIINLVEHIRYTYIYSVDITVQLYCFIFNLQFTIFHNFDISFWLSQMIVTFWLSRSFRVIQHSFIDRNIVN